MRTYIFGFAILVFSSALSAQEIPLSNLLREPASLPIFTDKFQGAQRSELTELLDHTFDTLAGLSSLKGGFSASIVLPDGSLWQRSFGQNAGLPTPTSLTPGTLMGMGSITKTFTTVAMLMLQDQGLLHLDSSIGTYLTQTYPNINNTVPVRMILNHRSGFGNYSDNPAWGVAVESNFSKVWTADEVLTQYVPTPFFPPNTGWQYSNTNFMIAHKIIENVTGQTYHAFVRENLINPFGLTHTWVYPWEQPTQPVAHLWLDITGDGVSDDVGGILPLQAIFSSAGGAGCLMSTTEDIARFMRMLFKGEILPPAVVETMKIDYVNDNTQPIKYGLGIFSFKGLPKENYGHNGYVFYQSIGLYFPEIDMAMAIQGNDASQDPAAINHTFIFLGLLDAYCDYLMTPAHGAAAEPVLRVFPNPANDYLFVQGADLIAQHEQVPFTLVSSHGTVVSKGYWKNGQPVSIHTLAPGPYALTLQMPGRTPVIAHFIKIH